MAIAFTFRAWVDPTNVWSGDNGDPQKFMEFLGWYPHAIAHGLNPLLNTSLSVPGGMNMMWDTTMPLPAVVMSPVTSIFGPVVAYNTILVVGLALDGWCTYLWLRRHVNHLSAAFVGGLIMEFGPYTGSRAVGHLNFVLVFAVPIALMAFEEIFLHQRWQPWKAGVVAGLVAAVQLLCAEEILAIFLVMGAVVAGALAIQFRHEVTRARVAYALRCFSYAAVVFLVICAYPLYFQFLGPSRVHGIINPPGVFSTDLTNLIVPNGFTALQIGPLQSAAQTFPGGAFEIESNSYVGIPMLVILGIMFWRWGRDPLIRTVMVSTVCAFVLALGPFLHVDGHHYPVPLPEWLLAHMPLFGNILPVRFGLFVSLGTAAVFALFVDRFVFHARAWLVPSIAGLGVLATLTPVVPLETSAANTPRFFQSGGDFERLPQDATVLVVPFVSGQSMLWQAQSGYRFSLVEGVAIRPKPDGTAGFFMPGPVLDAYKPLEGGTQPVYNSSTRSALLAQLHSVGTSFVAVGPMANQKLAVSFTAWVLGSLPTYDQGVYLWKLGA
jgi:hypothetical protein